MSHIRSYNMADINPQYKKGNGKIRQVQGCRIKYLFDKKTICAIKDYSVFVNNPSNHRIICSTLSRKSPENWFQVRFPFIFKMNPNRLPHDSLHSYDISLRIPTMKLKIPGKAFLKSESQTSVTFKLQFLTLATNHWQRM